MPGDWAKFFESLRSAGQKLPWAGRRPHPAKLPLVHPRERGVHPFYGSSLNFAVELREYYRALTVPERSIVPYLKSGLSDTWSGHRPDHGDVCPHCLGRIGPPQDVAGGGVDELPTLFYCPRCEASGFDDRLAGQRGLVGTPPPERRVEAPADPDGDRTEKPKRKTRKEIRAERFAGAGDESGAAA